MSISKQVGKKSKMKRTKPLKYNRRKEGRKQDLKKKGMTKKY